MSILPSRLQAMMPKKPPLPTESRRLLVVDARAIDRAFPAFKLILFGEFHGSIHEKGLDSRAARRRRERVGTRSECHRRKLRRNQNTAYCSRGTLSRPARLRHVVFGTVLSTIRWSISSAHFQIESHGTYSHHSDFKQTRRRIPLFERTPLTTVFYPSGTFICETTPARHKEHNAKPQR